LPAACIILSTSTETGREMAEKNIHDATAMIYYPLDIPSCVNKVSMPSSRLLCDDGNELWPNFIRACKNGLSKSPSSTAHLASFF
jgi:3-deoxy-D-manno-octulosonic-acid transferase